MKGWYKKMNLAISTKKQMIARITILVMFILGFIPFLNVTGYSAKGETTTAATTEITNINDIDVSMENDANGNPKIVVKGMDGDSTSSWLVFFNRFKFIISAISGFVFLIGFLMVLVESAMIMIHAHNPTSRSVSVTALIWTIIGMVVGGVASVICVISWNALR
mgnify:CR=1 FL=1